MKKTAIVFALILSFLTGYSQSASKPDELLTVYTRQERFNGTVLVSIKGKIILEKGYGLKDAGNHLPNDPASVYQIASVTKIFTAGLVLKLVQSGRLTLTDKLSKWYPSFPDADKITVMNLLSHTSGLFDYTRREDAGTKLNTERAMMAFLRTRSLDFAPGTQFRYSNSGYSVLGFIIAKVTGMPYEAAMRKYVFAPLHMTHSGFDFENLKSKDKTIGYSVLKKNEMSAAPFSDSATVFAAGAIYSTVEDLFLWHKTLQSGRFISRKLMDQAYTPVLNNYGYGWIIDSGANKKMVYHSGNIAGFSSVIMRIPEEDICIILLNNREGTELETIARSINELLHNRTYEIPKQLTAVTLPDSILQRYIGTYEISDIHLTLVVKLENGQLIATAVNGPSFPLTPKSETSFFIQDGQAEISFVTGADNKPVSLLLKQNNQTKTGKRLITPF